jgi:carbon monoxide dehydrogenase subunit G
VSVNIDLPYPCEEVYDFLDVTANHESFTDHLMHDWEYSGPDRGIGSKVRVKVTAAGRTEFVDIEVIAGERPTKIIEQNTGAGGRRVANGTYTLARLPDERTRVTFEYSWQRAPVSEWIAAPLVRSVMRRQLERAMDRLAQQLATRVRVE